MEKERTKYFTMRIPIDLHRTIKAHCAEIGISMKEFCDSALRHFLVASCHNLGKIQDRLIAEDIEKDEN